jgi:hypothetical protein
VAGNEKEEEEEEEGSLVVLCEAIFLLTALRLQTSVIGPNVK